MCTHFFTNRLWGMLILIFTALSVIFYQGCKDSSTNPPAENPPGYQEDIPWPSLADSPWPINHGNPQCNGRTKYEGPQLGQIAFTQDSLNMEAGIVTGLDSNIIFMAGYMSSGLYSIGYSGELLWKKTSGIVFGQRYSTPIISSDGTIYVTNGYKKILYAFDKNGTLKWKYSGQPINTLGINIGKDGTIYFLSIDQSINAVDKNGNLLWSYTNTDFNNKGFMVISFSPDGNTLYIPGLIKTVHAFDIVNKTVKWSYGDGYVFAAPMVDSKGNVYIETKSDGKYSFVSLSESGSPRWVYIHDNQEQDKYGYGEGTIDKNGNIYFALDTLYSLNYDGTLRWKKALGGEAITPLTSDVRNYIYTVINIGTAMELKTWSDAGSLIWDIPLGDSQVDGASPAIGFNRIFIPTYHSTKMFIIK